ncbi:MAG: hypothetical protein LBT58_05245 [Endomicrobium sp.]|nr:hypothetical protein [Endomicrobium sp.]
MKSMLSLVIALALLCSPLEGVFAQEQENKTFFERHTITCLFGCVVVLVAPNVLAFYTFKSRGWIYAASTEQGRAKEGRLAEIRETRRARELRERQLEEVAARRSTVLKRVATAGVGVLGLIGGGIYYLTGGIR